MLFRRIASLIFAGLPLLAAAQSPELSVEERLRRLEQRQQETERQLEEKDARIRELESQLKAAGRRPTPAAPAPDDVTADPSGAGDGVVAASQPAPEARAESVSRVGGAYEPGKGFVVARSDWGEFDFSAYTYARYLNQKGLDSSYTDASGVTRDLDLRNDAQFQKAMLYFKGWFYDPAFRYTLYTWTTNTSQGQGAQVVVAGNLSYAFNEMLNVGVGIGGLPTTRSTGGNFPNWLRVDNRTMADDFFRGSYTTGIWSTGKLTDEVAYHVMLGNNLSQLGVDAGQLDNVFNTMSGALWWMPTTGEYGPRAGFGDYEIHDALATRFGVHVTRSREDKQNQPSEDDPDNSQLRISDGTIIFRPAAFAPGTQINKATYQMAAFEAGMKYRGFSLEGEYYWRRLDDFSTFGVVPIDDLWDHGFQLQTSYMLIPRTLQGYLSGSKIFGEYGEPWDVAVGMNWFPFGNKYVRANTQFLYLDESAVGGLPTPSVVGGDGTVVTLDLELNF